MVDVDPDEELARQLHREMNGLTRVRRRGAPPLPPGQLPDGLSSRDEEKEASVRLIAILESCTDRPIPSGDRQWVADLCGVPGGRLESLKDSRPSSAQPSGEGGQRRARSKSNDGDQSSRDLHPKSGPQGFKRLRRHGGPRMMSLGMKACRGRWPYVYTRHAEGMMKERCAKDKQGCKVILAEDKVKAGDEGLEPQVSARGIEPRESSHHERHVAQQEADICPERHQRFDSMAASAASTVRQLAQRSTSDSERKRWSLCPQ